MSVVKMVLTVCLGLALGLVFVACPPIEDGEKSGETAGNKEVVADMSGGEKAGDAGQKPDKPMPQDVKPSPDVAPDARPAPDRVAPDRAVPDGGGKTDAPTPDRAAPPEQPVATEKAAEKPACQNNEKMCNGACVDVTKDVNNCGACGTACKAGETCEAGVCKGGKNCGPDVSFKSKILPIFNANCSCHMGGAGGLTLGASARSNLVNKPSRSGKVLVKPGDVAGSYLIDKLEGAAGISGARMPKGRGPLPKADIDAIKAWICNGAKDN